MGLDREYSKVPADSPRDELTVCVSSFSKALPLS